MTLSSIRVRVNGSEYQHDVEPRLLLVHFLRERCNLTGTHVGCETSLCGACTVLLDGKAVKSCTVFAVQADARQITTVEGLASGDELHPMQRAFWECHGLQCGFCTPGVLLTAVQVLDSNPEATRDEIAHALKGNLCLCTGYNHILDAVEQAAGRPPRREAGAR
jgi:aerobic carbon-monoxide dehydrogenase small subunit